MKTKAVRISVDNLMVRGLMDGCDGYIPVFDGKDLQAEASLPEVSRANARKLLKAGRRLASMIAGPGGILLVFTSGETYLATGFCVGGDGETVSSAAQIAEEGGLGTKRAWFQYMRALPSSYAGHLNPPAVSPIEYSEGLPDDDDDECSDDDFNSRSPFELRIRGE